MSTRRESFEEDGYVAVRSFLSKVEVAECHGQLGRFIAKVVPGMPADHVFYEDKDDASTLKQLQQIQRHDAWFAEFFNAKPRQLAEELLGTDVIGRNMQLLLLGNCFSDPGVLSACRSG